MSGIEVVAMVLKSADALLKTFSAIQAVQQYRDGRKELPTLVAESKRRVKQMRR